MFGDVEKGAQCYNVCGLLAAEAAMTRLMTTRLFRPLARASCIMGYERRDQYVPVRASTCQYVQQQRRANVHRRVDGCGCGKETLRCSCAPLLVVFLRVLFFLTLQCAFCMWLAHHPRQQNKRSLLQFTRAQPWHQAAMHQAA